MLSIVRSRRECVSWRWLRQYRSYSSATPDAFKVLFFGRDEFSCLVLQQLLQSKDVWHDIQVVTQPDTRVGRRRSQLSISPLKLLAQDSGLRVHTIPPIKKDFRTWEPPFPFARLNEASLSELPSHHLLVTASFGRILPNSLLGLFQPSRRLNVHPSLLPAYRGASPIQHALMDNRSETGVCVIEMMEKKKGIDAGSIWASEKAEIPEGAAFPELRDSLARQGGRLLVSVMRDMLAGKDTRQPQLEDPAAPRAPLIEPTLAMLDFRTMTAPRIAALHRAIYHQRPLTTVLMNGRTLQLHDPLVATDVRKKLIEELGAEGTATFDPSSQMLLIRCAEDTYITVSKVKQENRALLKAKEWWNGVLPELRVNKSPGFPVRFLPPPPIS